MSTNTRWRYIDLAKGILMLLVIYGHVAYYIGVYAGGCTNCVS